MKINNEECKVNNVPYSKNGKIFGRKIYKLFKLDNNLQGKLYKTD